MSIEKQTYKCGDRVEVHHPFEEKWYPGTITDTNDNGMSGVKLDTPMWFGNDFPHDQWTLDNKRIRSLQPSASDPRVETIAAVLFRLTQLHAENRRWRDALPEQREFHLFAATKIIDALEGRV